MVGEKQISSNINNCYMACFGSEINFHVGGVFQKMETSMITAYIPKTAPIRPDDWVQRRFRLPPSTARLTVELAFANRIATLSDHGDDVVMANWRDAQQVGGRS